MEYETINKETPEMKQLISGIKGLTNRVRSIAQTHRPLFEGEDVYKRQEVPMLVVDLLKEHING